MPFDFKAYDAKCANLNAETLQLEWEHYTRMISGAATSTAVSGAAVPFTFGVSSIGIGFAAPVIHNARKKREIIERHLQRVGRTHRTRKRDIIAAGTISGAVGLATLGLAPVGADAICSSAAQHGIAYIAENEFGVKVITHLGLDAVAAIAEESHMQNKKAQERHREHSQTLKAEKTPLSSHPGFRIPSKVNGSETNFGSMHQNNAYLTASEILDASLPKQQNSTKVKNTYFPPPPTQKDVARKTLSHCVHSVSTLSLESSKTSDRLPRDQRDCHLADSVVTTPMSVASASPVDQTYSTCVQHYQTQNTAAVYSPASIGTTSSCGENQQQHSYSASQRHRTFDSASKSTSPPSYTAAAYVGAKCCSNQGRYHDSTHYAESWQQNYAAPIAAAIAPRDSTSYRSHGRERSPNSRHQVHGI